MAESMSFVFGDQMYVFKTLTHVSFICTVYIRNENIHVTGNFCADIDECAAHNGWCTEHSTCNNTPGSYECVCDSGYKALGSKCVGQSVLLLIYTPSFALLSQFLHYGIVCGVNGRVSARLSVCLSVPSFDSSSGVRRVCCWAPLYGTYESTAAGAQQQRRRGTALSSICGQCRLHSRVHEADHRLAILMLLHCQVPVLL